MSFANPAALWYLLLIVPLGVLYILKVKPRRQPANALFLWHQVLERKKATSLFNKFRNLLSLLMLLSALVTVVLVMARPTVNLGDSSTERVIVVLDISASMNAQEGQTTRLALAKKQIADLLENLNEEQEVVLALADREVEVAVNATTDFRQIKTVLDQTVSRDLPLDLSRVAALKASGEANDKLYLVTDNCHQAAGTLEDVEIMAVGKPVANMGLVGFDLIRNPAYPERIECFYRLFSSYDTDQECFLNLCRGSLENVARMIPVTVKPGLNEAAITYIEDPHNGEWILQLETADALRADNFGYAYLPPIQPVTLGLAHWEEGLFINHCLQALVKTDRNFRLVDKNPDLVIAFGQPADTGRAQIIFAPQGQSEFWEQSDQSVEFYGDLNYPGEKADVLKFSKLEELELSGIEAIKPKPGVAVLAETAAGIPLVMRKFDGAQRLYILNFDPAASNLFTNVQFPVLIYSLAKSLSAQEIMPYLNMSSLEMSYHLPDFATYQPLQATATPPTESASRCGFYSTSGEKANTYGVSLLNAHESNLAGLDGQTFGQIQNPWPVRRWLLIAALLIVVLESVLYHQRRVD